MKAPQRHFIPPICLARHRSVSRVVGFLNTQPSKGLLWLVFLVGIRLADAQSVLLANPRTIAYLNQFRTDYTTSMRQQNPTLIKEYYADSVRLMPEFQRTLLGKANATAYYQAFHSRFRVADYTQRNVEILDLGTRVVELGLFTMNLIVKHTGQPLTLQGKYQTFWVSQPRASGEY